MYGSGGSGAGVSPLVSFACTTGYGYAHVQGRWEYLLVARAMAMAMATVIRTVIRIVIRIVVRIVIRIVIVIVRF